MKISFWGIIITLSLFLFDSCSIGNNNNTDNNITSNDVTNNDISNNDNMNNDNSDYSVPVLNNLIIQKIDTNSIILAQPTFNTVGNPKPSVTAYLGLDGTIFLTGTSAASSLEGPVDVSSEGYTFTGLNQDVKYRIIVIAQNSEGYSVEETTYINYSQNPFLVVADHTIVDQYDKIPDYWINEVKKMWVQVLGESHSAAYRDGLDLLETLDNKFQAETQEQGENENIPLAPTDQYLRLSRFHWFGYWDSDGVGEQYFWTTNQARDLIKSNILYCNETAGNTIKALGFGWCWDMTSLDGEPESALDTEFGVHWMGRSYYWDGIDYNSNYGAWGLDDTDYPLTNNPLSMKTYCDTIRELDTFNSETIVFYTTGPVDSGGEAGYQRWLKHEYIRNYVQTNGGFLFDYADILTWNDSGEHEMTSWNGIDFQVIHPSNNAEETGHISNTGAIRIAKALWWMLARIAGWDGISPY